MSDCLIWIVDDDADDLYMIKQAFQECSFEIRTFTHQESRDLLPALEKTLGREYPQLILLDINMPGISGKELLLNIRADNRLRHLPVVMFTTSASKADKIECMQYGANCFLTKPSSYNGMIKVCSSLATVFCTPEFSTAR